nr:MAG TPA: hypothetical protein [Caudoviricetes sp.]
MKTPKNFFTSGLHSRGFLLSFKYRNEVMESDENDIETTTICG